MPRYRITVPLTIHLVYEVEAPDEDAALDYELRGAVYPSVGDGISPGARQHRTRLSMAPWPESADYDQADIEELSP